VAFSFAASALTAGFLEADIITRFTPKSWSSNRLPADMGQRIYRYGERALCTGNHTTIPANSSRRHSTILGEQVDKTT
jgi:hypothetical protein